MSAGEADAEQSAAAAIGGAPEPLSSRRRVGTGVDVMGEIITGARGSHNNLSKVFHGVADETFTRRETGAPLDGLFEIDIVRVDCAVQ